MKRRESNLTTKRMPKVQPEPQRRVESLNPAGTLRTVHLHVDCHLQPQDERTPDQLVEALSEALAAAQGEGGPLEGVVVDAWVSAQSFRPAPALDRCPDCGGVVVWHDPGGWLHSDEHSSCFLNRA